MNLSNKSLTIIIVLSVCGLGFVFFDNPNESNDRRTLRLLDSDKSETRVHFDMMQEVESQDADPYTEVIEILNQELIVLRQDQNKMLETINLLVNKFENLVEQQYLTSLGQASVVQNDDEEYSAIKKSEEEIIQIRIESYESNLASQEIDSIWREQAHEKIESMIENQLVADSSIVSVDCRSSLCKLDLAHANEVAVDTFLEEFPAYMAWNNESFIKTEYQSDGSIRTMIYFSRDGSSLSENIQE